MKRFERTRANIKTCTCDAVQKGDCKQSSKVIPVSYLVHCPALFTVQCSSSTQDLSADLWWQWTGRDGHDSSTSSNSSKSTVLTVKTYGRKYKKTMDSVADYKQTYVCMRLYGGHGVVPLVGKRGSAAPSNALHTSAYAHVSVICNTLHCTAPTPQPTHTTDSPLHQQAHTSTPAIVGSPPPTPGKASISSALCL